jgi:hypothetical protein
MNRRTLALCALCLALAVMVRVPAAVVPAGPSLLATPARHRPQRGPSRDRSLPGKARRRARRAAR